MSELNGTIVPWLMGVFLALAFLALLVSLKSWRDVKKSPYFFLRRQAEKRLQSYLTLSVVLFAAAFGVAAYAWRAPTDDAPRMALLSNTKPVRAEVIALVEKVERAAVAETAVSANPVVNISATAENSLFADVVSLPAQFDKFEPTANLNNDTELGTIQFSTEISDNYEAVSPTRLFPEGSFTLYATFAYKAMANGMEWAWVWRHNGEVVDGGNEIWNYGQEGPGYIFFAPEEGFASGDYSLEVWVNGELLTRSTAVMNNAAVAAGN